MWRTWGKTLIEWARPSKRRTSGTLSTKRGQVTHVIILDGTMSTMHPGCETNAGQTCKLLSSLGRADISLYYEAGLQWQDWRSVRDVVTGRGINRQIKRAYGYLASRYRDGDKIFLLGYSRGAFAVRSLAGVIDRVGLLKSDCATERNIQLAYRHYQREPSNEIVEAFHNRHCHPKAEIEMIGAWDTVRGLGLRLPFLWRFVKDAHAFHDHQLGDAVKHGFHALAHDESRSVYAPVLWTSTENSTATVEQVWFRGVHGDIGGQLGGYQPARLLANIPLVWMLEKMESCGLELPEDWRTGFPQDVDALSLGMWRGYGKLFWFRRARRVGEDASEALHDTLASRLESETSKTPLFRKFWRLHH